LLAATPKTAGTGDHYIKRTASSAIRIPELDGLRGLAIFSVVVWHYVGAQTTNVALARILRLTWSGVDLFFVLSGFLIGGILLDHRRSERYFQAFYSRRCLRILPLYFASLALFFLLPAMLPALGKSPSLEPLLQPALPVGSYITFTQNFAMASRSTFGAAWLGITWSLAIEEQFYLVLPALIWLVPRRRLPMVLIAFGAVAPLLRIQAGSTFARHVMMPLRADSLLVGVLIAWMSREQRWKALLVRMRPALYAVAVVTFVVLGALCLLDDPFLAWTPWLYSVLAIFYAALLSLAITPAGPINWFFRQRWLRELGLLAYGVYLMHEIVNRLLHAIILGRIPNINERASMATTALAAAVTYVAAALSWRFFERPLVEFGHRVSYTTDRQVVMPVPEMTPL
jgi:peptidoglycan/LPS O-acetylase OafA/YrhL